MKTSTFYKQLDDMDCSLSLRLVADYYNRSISLDYLHYKFHYGKPGVSMPGQANAAECFNKETLKINYTIPVFGVKVQG